MLDLPDVTLCCIDTRNHTLAMRALERSRQDIRFARSVFITNPPSVPLIAPVGIEVLPVCAISSLHEYSHFLLKSLLQYVTTRHVLVVQWDGYVINAAAWDPAFLECDYLGAKWPSASEGYRVGNGGFSLRSRKLLQALQDPRITLAGDLHEDQAICGTYRLLLERECQIRFGKEELADRFSFETDHSRVRSGTQTFGFHGLFNLALAEPVSEIVALAPRFSDEIARSQYFEYLLRNCNLYGRWEAAIAVGNRILLADPANTVAEELVAVARGRLGPS